MTAYTWWLRVLLAYHQAAAELLTRALRGSR